MAFTSGTFQTSDIGLTTHTHEYVGAFQTTYIDRYPLFQQTDPEASPWQNVWVNYSIPVSEVPATASQIIFSVFTQADESQVYVDVSGTNVLPAREMSRAYGPNNSDDATSNWNTFIAPYLSSYAFRFRAAGDATPGQGVDFAAGYIDGYIP